MNPTHSLAVWFHGLVPDASDEVQGAAILLGILIPLVGAGLLAALGAWAFEKRRQS